MRIGIDAKWFFEGPSSGRVVIRNLVSNLVNLPTEDEFYIFLDAKERDKTFPYKQPNVHLIYVWAEINMLSNIFIVPLSALRLRLDVVVFQYFIPIFSNFKRYAYVHDVFFKTNPEFYTLLERIYFWPLKYLLLFAHRLCTVSETEKIRMIENGYGTNEKIDVIYHGVDEAFKPRELHSPDKLRRVVEKYGLPSRFILYVGRLNVRKNIANLFRSLLFMRNSLVPLVVVGGYEGKIPSIDELVKELGISERLIFTGPVFDDDLPCIYALATVFCFVSYAESFGLPPLEGMASGVPVIVSDRTCLPEICSDAALYVDPEKPAEIAEMIDCLLDNEQLWHEKREIGIHRAQIFTWRRSAEKLLESVHRSVGKDGLL